MRLPPMVSLMIEKVQENIGQDLGLRHSRRSFVSMERGQCSIVVPIDNDKQPVVLSDTSTGQFRPIFVQNGIESVGIFAFAG
jgi:hypothetical protein